MEVIGFLPDEISAALELLAAILNIGNATFEGYSLPNGTDACKMSAESTTCKFHVALSPGSPMRKIFPYFKRRKAGRWPGNEAKFHGLK